MGYAGVDARGVKGRAAFLASLTVCEMLASPRREDLVGVMRE